MKSERYDLWKIEEYDYPLAFGFIPNIVSYLHGDEAVRPCILIFPGGGFRCVSQTEGEIVAKEFYNKGYNAFVLTYTTDFSLTVPLGTQPLEDASRAIRFIRMRAAEFHIDADKLVICGFSAGGHLAASVCVHYDDVIEENPQYKEISNRPDAAILSYPVIKAGKCSRYGSFYALCGDKPVEDEMMQYMSLEKHVTPDTPPCFIWQTATDEVVPVENSYVFAKSCKAAGVPFAHHVFSQGPHGLSLANEDWAAGRYGEEYTAEQTDLIMERVGDGRLEVSEKLKAQLFQEIKEKQERREERIAGCETNREVMIWPILAEQWLKRMLKIWCSH